MSYSLHKESMAETKRMVAAAVLAGACLGVALSFSTSAPTALFTATATRVNPVTAVPVQPSVSAAYSQRLVPVNSIPRSEQNPSVAASQTAAQTSVWTGVTAAGVLLSALGALVAVFRKPSNSQEQFAMLAEAGEVKAWAPPRLEDALKNEKARKKAEAMSTQLPIFWEVRDDLGRVPKSEFPKVFDSYKGSTGTLLKSATTEEKYAITWTSSKTQIYELPTGGAAEMDEGLNIMYFARKEQCLALGAQLRTKFKPRIEDFAIYRIFPNGETQYLHPKDGVFPEKVNAGRQMANHNPRSIGENVEPASVKFSGKTPKDVETVGSVAMFAETGEKAPWTAPSLADAMKDTAAVEKAKAMSTQLPIFWDVRDDLGRVAKPEFPKVFDSYKGSTGTLLSAAEKEEKYVITWTSPKKQIYELPTGGAAEMDEGRNILFFARKEQCLALGAQLRTNFKPRIEDFQIYRVFPNGEVQYLHPKDGVFPEKVNQGRQQANHNARSIGENAEPASTKFSGKTPKDL